MININALGDTCPVPVIKAKNALKDMNIGEEVVISVDNKISTQNLAKMADEMGYKHSLQIISDENFEVSIVKTQDNVNNKTINDDYNTVVAISSDKMGEGHDELGAVLMKGFIYALTEIDTPIKTILFYNGGAKITTTGSKSLEDLVKLQAAGTEILTCGTCLNYYGLSEKLEIGEVTNMYTIVECLTRASKIIKP